MKIDALITVATFVLTVTYMLTLFINSRICILNREIEAWKCTEMEAENIINGSNFTVIGRIEIKTIYWNYTKKMRLEGFGQQKMGCAYTYRIQSDGSLLYVEVCPYKTCKP